MGKQTSDSKKPPQTPSQKTPQSKPPPKPPAVTKPPQKAKAPPLADTAGNGNTPAAKATPKNRALPNVASGDDGNKNTIPSASKRAPPATSRPKRKQSDTADGDENAASSAPKRAKVARSKPLADTSKANQTRNVRDIVNASLQDQLAKALADLERQKEEADELRKQLETNTPNEGNSSTAKKTQKIVPRPKGTAGTQWNIQIEMGLGGKGEKKYDRYKAIQRVVQELVLNARMDWKLPWDQQPARDVANLYDVVKERIPYMERFENNWATKAIAQQYIKNKRNNSYKNGWTKPAAKYAYLQNNAAKRSSHGSRMKKGPAYRPSASAAAPTRPSRAPIVRQQQSQNDDEDEEGEPEGDEEDEEYEEEYEENENENNDQEEYDNEDEELQFPESGAEEE